MVFRKLNKWNNIKEKCEYVTDKPDIDYLFIDMNGLISDKLHDFERDNSIDSLNEKKIAENVFDKIDINLHILNPKKVLGIFFDGVSPFAKISLQRQRRFREYYIGFKKKIQEKKDNDSTWRNINVIFSGPEVPNEGEYKIFEYIRSNKILSSNDFSYEKRCICTADSDFYLLSLALHQRNILIYNEYSNNFSKKKNFFSIDKLRHVILSNFPNAIKEDHNKIIDDIICLSFLTENNYLPGVYDIEYDDIIKVYMKFYKTNEFINNNGKLNEKNLKKFLILLRDEICIVNKMIYYLDNEMKDSCFNSDKEISSKFSEEYDDSIKFGNINIYMFKRIIFQNILNLCKDPKLKYIVIDYKNSKANEFLKFLCFKFNLSYTEKKQITITDADNKNNTYDNDNYWNFKDYCNRYNYDINNLKNLDDRREYLLLRRCKELNIKYTIEYSVISKKENCENDGKNILEKIKLKIDEDDRNGVYEEMKDDYYNNNIPNCNRREFINHYIEGIKWLLNTYYDKVPSWTWSFKYRYWKNKCKSYGPLISDLCNFEENENFEFDQGEPLKPITQLLTILPPESFNLLPNSYKKV
ncbi:hypothetical protein BCR32DRAFT_307636 [Anaeromyces robustus]|uniref:Xrn1 N-terminal domain-containing protein n=1 Tax=Anaeromyces robustus TaxID=1754192 RepID=A0A1Y1XDW4_9FUNG|nr:hypothetical protein BCR32DRAFT_307636 [Anaeromyces robustus]|eukprot:ORX83882.1 hypothetical protein BCR32DRAFT_307636 [Anaeromyces robustus]